MDDATSHSGRGTPLTGRDSLRLPPDPWVAFARAHRRSLRSRPSGFEITFGVLTLLFFLIMAVHVADQSPGGARLHSPVPGLTTPTDTPSPKAPTPAPAEGTW